MPEIEIKGKRIYIDSKLAKRENPASKINVAGMGQKGSNRHGNEGVYISSEYYRNDITGKPYPGRVNFNTQRVLAYNSTVVRAILTMRAHQVAKLPFDIKPKDKHEPPRHIDILDYNVYDLDHHPAFDEEEITFLRKIYDRLDPSAYTKDKQEEYKEREEEFTPGERATLTHLQKKHDEFYKKRAKDIRHIKSLFEDPDPFFTETRSWGKLLKSILMDILIIDRGVLVVIRDTEGEIRGLMPIDGSTVRPLINEYGTYDDDKAYVQVINGSPQVYLSKDDTIIFSLNPMTDLKYFGYGLSLMESLYTTVLSDIFIDKGNLDYYRKGGSIPEGFISVEPPPSRDGVVHQIDQEQLETIQRHLQSIMMGDYTQVPIISGGKINWVDFKGKRRDMQYKELAEHLTRKICAVFQVSPQDVGIISDVNRSTAQQQAEMTKSKGLETLMRAISEHFQYIINEIRPEADLMLWFDDDDMEEKKAQWQMDQQKLVSGRNSINEIRARDGDHPVPWGHTPLQGIRNWQPEEEGEGGLPGMGGGGLPPLPNIPGLEGNPGGPVGGDNPMAGGPEQPPGGASPLGSPSNLKSSNFFAMNAASEEDAHELMIQGFTDIYKSGTKMNEFMELHDIHNYPGSQWLRNPIESYEFFVNSHPNLGIMVQKSVSELDSRDPLVFSNYSGNGIVTIDEEGNQPIIKSLTKAVVDNLSEDKKSRLSEITNDRIEEAVERSIYKSLDPELKEVLYEDFYKFMPMELTDAQVEETAEILEL